MKKLLLDSHIAEVIGLLLLSLLLVTIAIGANGLSGREATEQERVLSMTLFQILIHRNLMKQIIQSL